jgi:hypothetical protein
MWLFGYSVGLSGSHILDPDGLAKFDAALEERCIKNPEDSVFDALSAERVPSRAVPKQNASSTAASKAAGPKAAGP